MNLAPRVFALLYPAGAQPTTAKSGKLALPDLGSALPRCGPAFWGF